MWSSRNAGPPLSLANDNEARASLRLDDSRGRAGEVQTRLTRSALSAAGVAIAAATAFAGEPALAPASHRTAVSVPGLPPVRLHAVEAGHGPPIVLLHGIGGSTYTWRNVLPDLTRSHRAIAIDLKGFGRSEKPLDEAYSPADQALLVAAYLEARGLSNVTLAGHSLGGTVALLAALELQRRDPTRVSRLVLIDSPAYPQPVSPGLEFLRTPLLSSLLLALVPPEWPARMALGRQHAENTVSDADIAAYAEPYREPGARHALMATARNVEPADWAALTSRYPTITQPTLLVWCLDDTLVPAATGLRLSRTLPSNRLATIEGCAHSPPDEKPAELVAILRPWLSATSPEAWSASVTAAPRN